MGYVERIWVLPPRKNGSAELCRGCPLACHPWSPPSSADVRRENASSSRLCPLQGDLCPSPRPSVQGSEVGVAAAAAGCDVSSSRAGGPGGPRSRAQPSWVFCACSGPCSVPALGKASPVFPTCPIFTSHRSRRSCVSASELWWFGVFSPLRAAFSRSIPVSGKLSSPTIARAKLCRFPVGAARHRAERAAGVTPLLGSPRVRGRLCSPAWASCLRVPARLCGDLALAARGPGSGTAQSGARGRARCVRGSAAVLAQPGARPLVAGYELQRSWRVSRTLR